MLRHARGMWCLRPSLPPYKFGDMHWAAAHVLCLAGAVLGGVGAWAFAATVGMRSCREACDEYGPSDNWLVRPCPASRCLWPASSNMAGHPPMAVHGRWACYW